MIRVQSITIMNFRGIRKLSLQCGGKSFAICGPNGTGKSGIVDALEFALTGAVSRLSGEGRGDVSVARHGPHVDSRDDPAKAKVSLVLSIPGFSDSVTIERSVKDAGTARVTPDVPEVRRILGQVRVHPEFVLSRRELIRYVLATPGRRAEEVGALLHLGQIEQVRGGLQKIANSCERALPPLELAVKNAGTNLTRALEVPDLTKERVVNVANERRATLGLSPIAELTASTSLKDGMATVATAKPQSIAKVQAQADLRALREIIAEFSDPEVATQVADVTSELSDLSSDPAARDALRRERFYTAGIDLIVADACPFCDTKWDPQTLRDHTQSKLEHLKEVSKKRKAIELKLAPLTDRLRRLQTGLELAARYAKLTTPATSADVMTCHGNCCKVVVTQIEALMPFQKTIDSLSSYSSIPTGVAKEIDALEKLVSALPEPSKVDAARDWLNIAQERLEMWRDAMRDRKAAKERAERIRRVSDTYVRTSDAVLTGLYTTVQDEFAELYAFINQDDESEFSAKLVPSLGKLGFDVDFYGRGMFPPGAYHSEGHQDGMGLCLYLALMRHLEGASFTFAVLDDVLMSVDADHRRAVCALLKARFPDTQFIVTTHDPIWLRHMRTEGLIGERASVQFRGWSVDQGPAEWDDRTVWTEIEDYLKRNDVRGAASLLRHYLEYMSKELCHRLRAGVEFRGDSQYQLGDLLPPAIGRLRALYRKAKDAANSWNQQDVVSAVAGREDRFSAAATASNAEQWQVNAAVHFNTWENLGRRDFEPVIRSFQVLLTEFACPECSEYLRVIPEHESPEALRCDCGRTSFNLQKKPRSEDRPSPVAPSEGPARTSA